MRCPSCNAAVSGNFCSSCGASLKPRRCGQCGAEPEPGDRFCNQCGNFLVGPAGGGGPAAAGAAAPAGGHARQAPGPGGDRLPVAWITAGVLLVALIVAVAMPRISQDPPPPPASQGQPRGAPALGASDIDLTSMTPRQAADRLFTRVMEAVSRGDSAEVNNFLPMSIAAYDRARPLDADGQFHLALLQLTGQDLDAARATVEAGLADSPDHLLLLSAAAEEAAARGDDEAAAGYYRRMLDNWDSQRESGLPEYEAHARMLPELESDARAFLEGRE